MSRFCQIAKIIKTKGLKGEVVVQSDYSLPLHFWDGINLHLVPPQHELPRECLVLSAQVLGDDSSFLLQLSGIDNKSLSQSALGCYLLAEEAHCVDLIEGDDSDSILGFEVIDKQAGYVGQITDVLSSTAQDVWVVARKDAADEQVLIPVVAEFIVEWQDGKVLMDLPQGLLGINR